MTELSRRVRDLLDAHQTMVIATVSPDAEPEAAAVFYAPLHENGRLSLVSALLATSTKLASLRATLRAGIYIGPQAPTTWLQGSALARVIVDDNEREQCLQRLVAHAPGAAMFVERVPVVPIVFAVTWLKLTDLTGGTPPIETFEIHG